MTLSDPAVGRINASLSARWSYFERERELRFSRYWHGILWRYGA